MTRNRRIEVFEIMRFIIAMIIMSVTSLFIVSCDGYENQDEELNNENNENEEAQSVPNRTNVQQLLAIAVDKSFENGFKQQFLTKNVVLDMINYQLVADTNNLLHVIYPYDYIQIYDVVKFSCAGVISPIVQAICGDGEVEVFIANFALFENAEEEKIDVKSSNIDKNTLQNMINVEPMIVFKSELGIYSCIANGGGQIDASDISLGYYIEFSSHKYLSDKALEKELLYPVFQFIVKSANGKITLKTTSIDEYTTTIYANEIPFSNQQIVSSQELFNLIELSGNILEVSLQCEVTELNENYFIVKTDKDFNLERVYYDEYTGFFIGDKSATYADIAVGDVINVTFDKLYESYNPKSVIANKIFY